MPSTYGLAKDDFRTTTPGHTAGANTLDLAAGAGARLGALPANRVYRLTAVTDPDTPDEVILGVFEATGLDGDTLTGVTASAGYANVALPAGTTIDIRMTALHLAEVQDALNAAETTLASHVANASNPHSVTKAQVGLASVPDVDATDRANHTGTQLASTISDLSSAIAAYLAAHLAQGANVTISTDGAGVITIAASGGGGLAIGAAISGGTAGRLLYEGPGGTLADSASLTFGAAGFATTGATTLNAPATGTSAALTLVGNYTGHDGDLFYADRPGSGVYTRIDKYGNLIATSPTFNSLTAPGGQGGTYQFYARGLLVGESGGTNFFELESVNGAGGAGSLLTRVRSSTDVLRTASKVATAPVDNTDATRTYSWTVTVSDYAGDRVAIGAAADGTQALLGFYGAAPVARAAAPTTLADVIAILTNLGLCS